MTDSTDAHGGTGESHTRGSTEPYVESVRRLHSLAERDPETFERLVNGEVDGIERQLVQDMQRVNERLLD